MCRRMKGTACDHIGRRDHGVSGTTANGPARMRYPVGIVPRAGSALTAAGRICIHVPGVPAGVLDGLDSDQALEGLFFGAITFDFLRPLRILRQGASTRTPEATRASRSQLGHRG